jgi:hypothetical protein
MRGKAAMKKPNNVLEPMARVTFGVILVVALACSRQNKEEEACDTAPDKVQAAAKPQTAEKEKRMRVPAPSDADWCRACVVGPHGFMSCQRVNGSYGESLNSLRERARIKACLDSGFTEASCPSESVIAISCKDDKPAKDKTAAGKKVMQALKKSGPLVLTSDPKLIKKIGAGSGTGSDSKSPEEEKAPKKANPK